MGYPGLLQHAYICLFTIFHLNNKICLHSSLTLLDAFIGSEIWMRCQSFSSLLICALSKSDLLIYKMINYDGML